MTLKRHCGRLRLAYGGQGGPQVGALIETPGPQTSNRRDVFGCSEERLGLIASDGLTDRSRRPYRHANQLPVQIEMLIVRCKQDKPHWGAPKMRERLARLYPDVHTPATRCRRSSAAQARRPR